MTKPQPPKPAESSGRQPDGKFAKGNRAGQGNPHAKRAQQLRSAVLAAVKPSEIKAVVLKLVELAKGGDTVAAKLLFDRVLGKSSVAVDAPAVPGTEPEQSREHEAGLMLLSMEGASNVG